ncbi:MAG TPA: hypothetical protein VKV15_20905 [Bryobacteraceae bacterium]|nr:hypothetical protein [Bryobacteraceae bacterium]
MTPERVVALRSQYTSDARWRREMEIQYEALEGELLYPEWKRELSVCEPFDVSDPAAWTIYHACDPHGRTPHAFIWEAFNKFGDRAVCGELWSGRDFPGERFTVAQYCHALDWLESDSMDKPSPFDWARGKKLSVYYRVMDTHGAAVNSDEGKDFFDTYARHGFQYFSALKGEVRLAVARDSVASALLPVEITTGTGKFTQARLRVFEGCAETIDEFERVRYPEGDPVRPADERPMTYRKHLLDCLHYVETAQPRFVLPKWLRSRSTWKPIHAGTGY